MKFEYDKRDDRGECVAYIDGDGDLIIKDQNPDEGENTGAVYLTQGGNRGELEYGFDPEEATHKFYPGDKLTITF